MDAANKEVDPANKEAKGGSGEVQSTELAMSPPCHCLPAAPIRHSHSHRPVHRQVGKMLLSMGEMQLGLLCYVPASKLDKCNASKWMEAVLKYV
jgi:hypothetical protein